MHSMLQHFVEILGYWLIDLRFTRFITIRIFLKIAVKISNALQLVLKPLVALLVVRSLLSPFAHELRYFI